MPYTDVIFPLLIVVLLAYIILKMRKGSSGVVAGSEELPGWAEQQLAEGKAKVEALSQELKSKEEALVQLQISSAQEVAGLKGQLNAATEKLDTIQKLHQEQKAEAEKSKEAMKNEFKVLAESILEEKKKQFKTTNSEELDKLLAPFKQKLEDFEKTVKDNHEKEVKSTSALMENIKSLKDMNDKLSEEASGLAKALRGDNKKQGNWGEFVLERALEMSGLQKDKEYFVQNSETTDEGRRLQPDVIIQLPGNKKIIIDSKVSLVAWDNFINAENEDDAALHMKALSTSVQAHIKNLSDKDYPQLYGAIRRNLCCYSFLLRPRSWR